MSQLPFLFLFIYYVCGRNKLPLKKRLNLFWERSLLLSIVFFWMHSSNFSNLKVCSIISSMCLYNPSP